MIDGPADRARAGFGFDKRASATSDGSHGKSPPLPEVALVDLAKGRVPTCHDGLKLYA